MAIDGEASAQSWCLQIPAGDKLAAMQWSDVLGLRILRTWNGTLRVFDMSVSGTQVRRRPVTLTLRYTSLTSAP